MRRFVFCLGLVSLRALTVAYSQAAPETTRVQIVNATSVPAISLKINETLVYPTFAQGMKSADGAVPVLEAVYEAEDKRSGARAKSDKITYEPSAFQSLVIVGDFSLTPVAAGRNKPAPNVRFEVFSHAAKLPPVRLRIINGMPGKTLKFAGGGNERAVSAGDHAVLENQPAIAQYSASVDGLSIPVLMRQEGLVRNAMVVFYLKDGQPAFLRAFENNTESNRARTAMEKAEN